MSPVHVMLLNNSSIIRPPPSLLSGFPGLDYPPFNQYYAEAKTAFVLLVAFGFPRLPYPCGVVGFLSADASTTNRICPGVWIDRPNPGTGSLLPQGGGRPSQVPVNASCPYALLSDPGWTSLPDHSAVPRDSRLVKDENSMQ